MKQKVKNGLLIGLFGLLTIGAFSALSKGLNDWINSSSSSSTNYISSSSISSSTSSNTSILSSSTSSTSEKNNTSSSDVSVEDNVLQVGTYKFIDNPNAEVEKVYSEALDFKSAGQTFGAIMVGAYTGMDYSSFPVPAIRGKTYNSIDGWSSEEYKTIILESNQTVTQEFYTWFKANTLRVYTLPTLDVKAEGYNVSQGDIAVKEDVYNAITKLNNSGSLTDFGNSCGLTIPNTMKPYFKMGAKLISTHLSNQNKLSAFAPEISNDFIITLTIDNLDKEKSNNVHLLEFDYSNNTTNYVSITPEHVDVENHCVTFSLSKVDGSLLTLLCYEDSNSETNLTNRITDYEYYDSINSHVSVSAGGNIESIDLESISVDDLISYSKKVKNVICFFNNDDELPEGGMSFINKELNGIEGNIVKTNCETIINLTQYKMVNDFVKFKIVGTPTNVIQFSVYANSLHDYNKDDLIAIIINKSGLVEFLELDNYDPEIGECTITSSLIQDYSIIVFAVKVGDSTVS